MFIAGAVVQWLRDELQIIRYCSRGRGTGGFGSGQRRRYLVPAFAGLGAPHWDQYARGTMVGLTRGTNRAHIARAALEGIAFQVKDVLEAMQADAGVRWRSCASMAERRQ